MPPYLLTLFVTLIRPNPCKGLALEPEEGLLEIKRPSLFFDFFCGDYFYNVIARYVSACLIARLIYPLSSFEAAVIALSNIFPSTVMRVKSFI